LETAFCYCVKTHMQGSFLVLAFIAAMYLISAISFAVPALFCRETGTWKQFLWTTAALVSLGALAMMFVGGSTVSKSWPAMSLARHIAIAAFLAWAVADDLRHHVRRIWSHWVGVLILAAGDGVQVILESLSV